MFKFKLNFSLSTVFTKIYLHEIKPHYYCMDIIDMLYIHTERDLLMCIYQKTDNGIPSKPSFKY